MKCYLSWLIFTHIWQVGGCHVQILSALYILLCPGAASKSVRGGHGQKGSLSSALKSIMDGEIQSHHCDILCPRAAQLIEFRIAITIEMPRLHNRSKPRLQKEINN